MVGLRNPFFQKRSMSKHRGRCRESSMRISAKGTGSVRPVYGADCPLRGCSFTCCPRLTAAADKDLSTGPAVSISLPPAREFGPHMGHNSPVDTSTLEFGPYLGHNSPVDTSTLEFGPYLGHNSLVDSSTPEFGPYLACAEQLAPPRPPRCSPARRAGSSGGVSYTFVTFTYSGTL